MMSLADRSLYINLIKMNICFLKLRKIQNKTSFLLKTSMKKTAYIKSK